MTFIFIIIMIWEEFLIHFAAHMYVLLEKQIEILFCVPCGINHFQIVI